MPKKKQVRKYLRRNGWRMIRDTDHEYYQKDSADGEPLKTKLSHGDGEIPASVRQILLMVEHVHPKRTERSDCYEES